jgi:signal transduction histidine kinase
LPPGPVPLLRADPDRLLQVLLNLLSNAAKFMPDSAGRADLRLRLNADTLTVEVQDNGPGIPPEQQTLVFEKFRQGGDASHRPQGTGLGLPISRRIVEHFGGRLWLRSEPGQGACFGFDLPLNGATRDKNTTKETNP